MSRPLHITSGDSAGASMAKSGVTGEVFVWHDVLYDGTRNPGWPTDDTLNARALFLEQLTGGGLDRQYILQTLRTQYRKLTELGADDRIVLWFDACLFDQSMLAHILTCLHHLNIRQVELLCVDAFAGIEPFHGLGQLQPEQLAAVYGDRRPVTNAQFQFAVLVDKTFATQDATLLTQLSQMTDAPLPWIPAAVARWLEEQPNATSGLGRLEQLALTAIRTGCETPQDIFASVAAAETPPQFWGDTTLWAKINALAEREVPLVCIRGPAERLPQWPGKLLLADFLIKPIAD